MISVIVPVYNVEKYLNKCIDSILNQSYDDFELILVDDGSPDNCGKICDDYAKKDGRIIVIHKKNGGLSDARNKGIDWVFENSESEWITFIDSDDWVHRDYLKFLLEAAVNNNAEISVCNFIKTKTNIQDSILSLSQEIYNTEDFFVTHNQNAVVAWGKLYKKHLFMDIRYPYGKIHEDNFTTYKLLFKKDSIIFITNQLYYHFQHEGSIMNSKWNPDRLVAIEAFEEAAEFFKNNNYINAQWTSYLYSAKFSNSMLCYKIHNKKDHKADTKYLKRKLREHLHKYRKLSKKPIYETPAQFNTAYPHFMKIYWLYRGIRQKIQH